MITPKCPACGCTRVQYHYSTSTAMGWPHIIENGVDVSENPNWITSYYSCCNADCRHDFHIVEHLGEIDVVDDGAKLPVPTTEMPINEVTVGKTISSAMLTISNSDTNTGISIPSVERIDKIEKKLDELEKKVDLIVSKISQM